ncbi:MAG: F0F1 ATP synthase subunit A [Clostridia bacterium]|nr:F0F1 ATP synthase subunit A [Clostridia bacterium]
MMITKTVTILEFAVSALLFAAGLAGYCFIRSKRRIDGENKTLKIRSKLFFALMIIAAWFFVGTAISSVSHATGGLAFELELFSERVEVFGVSFAQTSVIMWIITAAVLLLSLVFRFFLFPRFSPDRPKGFQNVMELSVEFIEKLTVGAVSDYGTALSPYMFTIAVFLLFSEIFELLGFRPPTADLPVTLAMGLITFALINYYGVKKKGVIGRVKDLASPTPVILPMKILSDVAVPVSLACRLFGNMLGGLIVMDLLKSALGGYGSGLPAVAGLYFNLFHPGIQAYIFIILSLTFINEAIE